MTSNSNSARLAALSAAGVVAHTLAPAWEKPAPTPAAPQSKTRATFYAQKNGGGYRTARTTKKCEQFGCYKAIVPGEQFFDTREVTTWPRTKCLCAGCAEAAV